MNGAKALQIVFNVILGAAALKASLNTLRRPMSESAATPTKSTRVGQISLEGYDDALEYEDLL